MKKVLLLMTTTILGMAYSYGQARTSPIKLNVRQYLLKHLDNPASYSPVSWGKMEATMTEYEYSDRYDVLKKKVESYEDAADKAQMLLIRNAYAPTDTSFIKTKRLLAELGKEIDHTNNIISTEKKAFKPKFSHYYLEHTFRARNKFNALILSTYIFVLDKNYKVISSYNKEDMEKERQDLQNKIDELTRQ